MRIPTKKIQVKLDRSNLIKLKIHMVNVMLAGRKLKSRERLVETSCMPIRKGTRDLKPLTLPKLCQESRTDITFIKTKKR